MTCRCLPLMEGLTLCRSATHLYPGPCLCLVPLSLCPFLHIFALISPADLLAPKLLPLLATQILDSSLSIIHDFLLGFS